MAAEEADIIWKDFDAELVDSEIEHLLSLKGYCVLDMGPEDDLLFEVLSEVRALKVEQLLQPPAPEIVDGLLGDEGSGGMFHISNPDVKVYAEGKHLQEIDENLSKVADGCARFFGSMGFTTMLRSPSVLLQGGMSDFDGPELTEEACSNWISIFSQARLMLVFFLGPNNGSLELHPLGEDEPGLVEITTRPNTVVVLRCDRLARKHYSSSLDYAMCCWITLPELQSGPRGWLTAQRSPSGQLPYLEKLQQWAKQRMEKLYGMELDGTLDESTVPREWLRIMHHNYFRQSRAPVAIRGQSGHLPGQHDSERVWKAFNRGLDLLLEIPYTRWDHSAYYDPDPGAWMNAQLLGHGHIRTAVRHCAFIDGVEFFDNKFFRLSLMEAKGMDPMQRHILETSYESLFDSGLRRSDLAGLPVAVYTGSSHPEWAFVYESNDEFAMTNSSQALLSNRTSYLLGLKGPSTSVDCEMASSSMALLMGASTISQTSDSWVANNQDIEVACCGGVYFCMTPLMWPRHGAFMNPNGRCFTFDSSANGYVRGELCGSLCLKPYSEIIQQEAAVSSDFCYGTIAGWRMSTNGHAASLTAPCGPAEQEACLEATKHAGIDVLDLDGAECHGIGGLLADAVEATSLAQALRGGLGGDSEGLLVGASKTYTGAMCEACGIMQVLKVIFNILYGTNTPSLHLQQLNPHMELGRSLMLMHGEQLAYRDRGVFHGVSSRGWGGANVNMVLWYSADKSRVYVDKPDFERADFSFWPGGGGVLSGDSRPSEGYSIMGSWSSSGAPEEMETGEGTYTFIVTLGVSRYETFQIWVDGEEDRVLHPGVPNAPAGHAVEGPSHVLYAEGLYWRIDGRELVHPDDSDSLALESGEARQEAGTIPTRDSGQPGDQYEVQLLTAGRYRAVTWQKVRSGTGITQELLRGSYFIVGSFNSWTLQEMQPSSEEPGLFSVEIGPLRRRGAEFHIVRNRDSDQMFYPADEEGHSGSKVCGPSELGDHPNWQLRPNAELGFFFRVEFRRTLQDGRDDRRLTWTPIQQ